MLLKLFFLGFSAPVHHFFASSWPRRFQEQVIYDPFQVAEELEKVKLDQQALSESRAAEQRKVAELEELKQQLKEL